MVKISKELLLPSTRGPRHLSFGGRLSSCRESLKEAINEQVDNLLPIQWYTDDPYNAGQAVTLLEVSGYSFDVYHDESDSGYSFQIMTSFRESMHFFNIDPIKQPLERISFEQGRYDSLMELLDRKSGEQK